jgi:glycosyltransferase involved in cell wall biosynthesis
VLLTNINKFIVGVPTYNRAHLLPRVIESVRKQKIDNWVILFVNDASRDNTQKILDRYKEELGERFYCFSMAENSGVNAVRNRILEEALSIDKDAWLVLIDDDDFLKPDCLTIAAENILAHPDYHWHTLDCEYTSGKRISRMKRYGDLSYLDDYMFGKTMRGDMTHVIQISEVGDARFSDRFKNAEVWYFWCQLAARHRLNAIEHVGSVKEYLPEGITNSAFNRDKAIQVLEYKIETLEPLVGQKKLKHQYVSLAKQYIKQKDYSNARTLLKKCLKSNPFYLRSYRYLWVMAKP